MCWYKKLCMFLSLAVLTHVAYNIFFKKKKKDEKAKIFNEVIMFSYGVNKIKKKSKCYRFMITKRMNRLLYYLNKPRHNLDISMYMLTNMDIIKALLKLHYRGVRIRIIIDANMLYFLESSQSGIKRLVKQGVRVRWIRSANLMRNTFCLADTLSDNKHAIPFVITGFLYWTNQRFNGNSAVNITVTTQNELVQQYKDQFEILWNSNTV